MITIASKARLLTEQVRDKVKRGSHYLEIHLADEFSSMSAEELFNEPESQKCFDMIEIASVHSPIFNGRDCLIEDLYSRDMIIQSARFAELIANRQDTAVHMVAHTATSPRMMDKFGILDSTIQFVKDVIEENPHVVFEIEMHTAYTFDVINNMTNLTPLSTLYIKDDKAHISNIDIVKMIDAPRCMALSDTCHIEMMDNWLKDASVFLEALKVASIGENLMSQAIAGSRGILDHIHLSRAIGDGYGVKHGRGFSLEDAAQMKQLQDIVDMLSAVDFDDLIVLEVLEDDYLNSERFSMTLKALRQVLDGKGIPYRF